MSLAGLGFGLALGISALAAIAAVLTPLRARSAIVGVGTAAAGAAAVVSGVAAIAGQTFAVTLPNLLPLFGIRLELDPLGGLFVAVTGGVGVATAIYGIGYAGHGHGLDGRPVQLMLPLFLASMLVVPAAASVSTFLVCWELMALTSLLLVLAEHRKRAEVGEAGVWYAGLTHLGMVAILIGFVLFAAYATDDSFSALRAAADEISPTVRGVVFVATLIGFAAKAGVAPLHAWLPRAHPEAPSHVSALMSAAMVNLGATG